MNSLQQRKSSSGDVKEVKAEADPQQMREWLKVPHFFF